MPRCWRGLTASVPPRRSLRSGRRSAASFPMRYWRRWQANPRCSSLRRSTGSLRRACCSAKACRRTQRPATADPLCPKGLRPSRSSAPQWNGAPAAPAVFVQTRAGGGFRLRHAVARAAPRAACPDRRDPGESIPGYCKKPRSRLRLDAECRGSSCDPRDTRDVDGPCDAGSGYGCPSGERPSLGGVSLARSLSGSLGRAQDRLWGMGCRPHHPPGGAAVGSDRRRSPARPRRRLSPVQRRSPQPIEGDKRPAGLDPIRSFEQSPRGEGAPLGELGYYLGPTLC